VKNLPALHTRREVFIDQRGVGLRVTWHPEQDLLVLSVWDNDRCVGTGPNAITVKAVDAAGNRSAPSTGPSTTNVVTGYPC
jgi:hypothetical protein